MDRVESRIDKGDVVARTVTGAFEEFRQNLEITERQEALVASRHQAAIAALKAAGISLHPNESALIGSYDRHTLIRLLSEGDVDVMAILHFGNNQGWNTGPGTRAALASFRAALTPRFPSATVSPDRNCVTVKFPEFRLDVVPAFAQASGGTITHYTIPDTIRQAWIPTNPIAFQQRMTNANAVRSQTFIPLVKMAKAWNRNEGWLLRSFHLECLLLDHCQGSPRLGAYPVMLRDFFQMLPYRLSSASFDPVVNDRVDTYLDETAGARAKAVARAQAAATVAGRAIASEGYPAIALAEWKSILGQFFPSYG